MVFKVEDTKDVWDKRHQETEVTHTSVEKFQRSKSNSVTKRLPKQSISANGGNVNEYGYSHDANNVNDFTNMMVLIIIMKMVIMLDPTK